jgi:hypothetical protein
MQVCTSFAFTSGLGVGSDEEVVIIAGFAVRPDVGTVTFDLDPEFPIAPGHAASF